MSVHTDSQLAVTRTSKLNGLIRITLNLQTKLLYHRHVDMIFLIGCGPIKMETVVPHPLNCIQGYG